MLTAVTVVAGDAHRRRAAGRRVDGAPGRDEPALARSFRATLLGAIAVGVASAVLGLAAARQWALAAGGAIVLVSAAVFAVASSRDVAAPSRRARRRPRAGGLAPVGAALTPPIASAPWRRSSPASSTASCPGTFVWRDPRVRRVPLDQPDAPGPHARRAPRRGRPLDRPRPALAAHLFEVAQTIGQAQQAALGAAPHRRDDRRRRGARTPTSTWCRSTRSSELSFAHADPEPARGLARRRGRGDPRRAPRPRRRARRRTDHGRPRRADRATTGSRATPTVVWHGFTQMAAYAENAPVIVERAEGHELDRRRRHAATSTRSRRCGSTRSATTCPSSTTRSASSSTAARTRRCSATATGSSSSSSEALARVVPVDDPHFLYASDGASAVEQALKIAFQYWVNRGVEGRTHVPRVRRRVPRRHHRRAVGRRRRLRHRPVRPAALPRAARAGVHRSRVLRRRVRDGRGARARRSRRSIVEPLVQGAAGMQLADPDGLARARRARAARTTCCSICDEVATGFGRTGTLFASEQCGLRPDLLVLGKGLTAGYLPDVGDRGERPRVRRLPRPRPRRAHALPRPLVLRERARRRGRAPPPRAARRVGRARQRARPLRRAARPARRPHRAAPGGARGPPVRAHGRRRARAADRRPALGPAGVRGRGRSAACCCARSATSSC